MNLPLPVNSLLHTGAFRSVGRDKFYRERKFNLFLTPMTDASFKINIWLDGPWDNSVWKGKKIGEITVPAGLIISNQPVLPFMSVSQ